MAETTRENSSSESERRRGTNPGRSSAQFIRVNRDEWTDEGENSATTRIPHDTRICIEDLVDMEISEKWMKRKENSQGLAPQDL